MNNIHNPITVVAHFRRRGQQPRANEHAGVFSITEEKRAREHSLSSPQRIICLDLAGSILSSYCFATGGYLLWRGFVGVHFPPG